LNQALKLNVLSYHFALESGIQRHLAPFGSGDFFLIDADDMTLGPFELNTPIVFYGVPESKLFVSTRLQ
jgi:hypothetical protein